MTDSDLLLAVFIKKSSVIELGSGNKRRGLNRDFQSTPYFDFFERNNKNIIAVHYLQQYEGRNDYTNGQNMIIF